MIAYQITRGIEKAKQILDRDTYVFGPFQVEEALGWSLGRDNGSWYDIPIPFTRDELITARSLDQHLILQVHMLPDGNQVDIGLLMHSFKNNMVHGRQIFNKEHVLNSRCLNQQGIRPGWRLVSNEIIPGSRGKNYFGQTVAIADYLEKQVYEFRGVPELYLEAIKEFRSQRKRIGGLVSRNPQSAARELASMKINQYFRQSPQEIVYGTIVQQATNRRTSLGEHMGTTTSLFDGNEMFSSIGGCVENGMTFYRSSVDYSNPNTGVIFSRAEDPATD
jgi:hypothetical protein